MKKLVTLFAMIAGIAGAATYNVKLLDTTRINGTELKPGEYKVEVLDNKAVFRHGKQSVEAPAKVENAQNKFNSTTLRYGPGPDGRTVLQQIQVGGSTTRIVFAN